MALTWKFYADAGLTVELATGGATIVIGGDPTDRIIYFGSAAAGKSLQAASAPGADQVQIQVADADAGAGIAATALKLALSAAGLNTAVAGAALDLGATLASGVANAIAVFVRSEQGTLGNGSYPDLSLTTNGLVES